MENTILDKSFTYAIVGATDNPNKYGHTVCKDLLEKGYQIIPINPKRAMVCGQKTYARLSDVTGSIDVVVFVVPPHITERLMDEVIRLGITRVWMQPGSESERAIATCKEHSIQVMHNACIMVQ